jgi:Sulfotransferase family
MTFDVDELEAQACDQTGLSDFGDPYYREGLGRLVASINSEADLNEMGELIQQANLLNLLTSRLKVEETYRLHPEIAEGEIEGPVIVIGLPRTGTTALSLLISADPQFRSLRMWESQSPTPPPEAASQDCDTRIAEAAAGLEMMDAAFPLMKTMHHSEPTGATECQDLMGMTFRTYHFDGMLHVPSYTKWVLDCDMSGTYAYHRRVLKLLQWHCPPNLWHLKTPVHIFALDALAATYPQARFVWSHRDPAKVLGSVCSLIHYVRSWSSDRDDRATMGTELVDCWAEGIERAMDFRARTSEDRFVDVAFADLQTKPVETLSACYEQLGLNFSDASRTAVRQWAAGNKPGARGEHTYQLSDYGLTVESVRERFGPYLERYDATA